MCMENRIKSLENRIEILEDNLWDLKNPPKFKLCDIVEISGGKGRFRVIGNESTYTCRGIKMRTYEVIEKDGCKFFPIREDCLRLINEDEQV
jgi:hypothetical protein